MKKILAMILAVALIMSLAVPALAAGENHTITINQDTADHTYAAYQIFTGKIETNALGDKVLTEIQWGSGINGTTFLAALKEAFPGIYGAAEDATQVAEQLADNSKNNIAHAEAFAHLAGQHLTDVYASTNTHVDDSKYVITGLDAGYYMVKELSDVQGLTKTDLMLKLVEDAVLNPKDGKVTVEKTILEGQTVKDVSDAVIGKPVTFELYGTLPGNYHTYSEFFYAFRDTLSKGLTYDGDSYLYVEFDNGSLTQEVDPSHYTVSHVVNAETGETSLSIVFDDLVELGSLTDTDGNSVYTIDDDTIIYVKYQAHLNDDAIIGSTGNPNEVYVEYDNDPDGEGTGKTEEDIVHVFTFALDMTKIDGSIQVAEGVSNRLANVGFKLYTNINNVTEYAIVNLPAAEGQADDGITDWTITGWTTNIDEGTTLYTDANGEFTVYGLDVGTYYLKETAPLEGYNSIPDLMFIIKAGYDISKQTLTELNITYGSVFEQDGNLSEGSVDVTIENNPGSELPSTGGMGTTMFYLFGGLMVLVALSLLVTKKRMTVQE